MKTQKKFLISILFIAFTLFGITAFAQSSFTQEEWDSFQQREQMYADYEDALREHGDAQKALDYQRRVEVGCSNSCEGETMYGTDYDTMKRRYDQCNADCRSETVRQEYIVQDLFDKLKRAKW
jgi:hypothetical protein